MVISLTNFYRFSKLIWTSSNKSSKLDFIIHSFAFGKVWFLFFRLFQLSPSSPDRCTRKNNRRGSPMITNRKMKPVLIERTSLPSPDEAIVVSMRKWRWKVCKITNFSRHMVDNIFQRTNELIFDTLIVFNDGIDGKKFLNCYSGLFPVWSAKFHKIIKKVSL